VAIPLLETKLYVPKLRRSLVVRPRLHEHLSRGAELKLTLISAPAGFGKTTVVAEWLAADPTGGPLAAWLSLDPERLNALSEEAGEPPRAAGRVDRGRGHRSLDRVARLRPGYTHEMLSMILEPWARLLDEKGA
jgi:hypothetical protein